MALDCHVVPSVGRKVPPCKLPVWCVIPDPDDIKETVELVRRSAGDKLPPKRLLFGKRAWVVLGRRIQEGAAEGPQPDIGLVTPRASRVHAMVLRNWLGQVFLMDLGSGNGTFLDAKRLPRNEPVRWHVGSSAVFADDRTETFELRPAG